MQVLVFFKYYVENVLQIYESCIYIWLQINENMYCKIFNMEQERKMTIQPRMIPRALGRKEIPELRLSGLWLEAVGFKAGSKVVIEVRENELIIKPA
jgi:hypothetical protein